ncbi:hypothetical protein DCAR_0625502 [Daucus carota subsp. sativus]|uniref:Uncharacterized protein n=1 Tax=Daucus carota subsp. sativus TaxID=79200 RepID=A0A164WHN1_DAUCS|nr:PREDICTED: uncharacterized protein LOC108226990 [Daucus carota subsp. sativus]WOH06079.1 hypothetical protein DCAR_0625502 [Daucus carota subsp. sativus]
METSGIIVEKFIKFLTNADLMSDELLLPEKILSQYGNKLPKNLLLKFRNGYEIPVSNFEEGGLIYGISSLYEDFEMEPGQLLVFEYDGQSGFNVYVIGKNLVEIDYPLLVHETQKTRPRNVNVKSGGLKFIKFLKEEEAMFDDFEHPRSFKKAFHLLPGYQNFIFSNGKQTEVVYKHDVGRFCGLNKFWSMEGIEDLSSFNLALFSYEEPGVTTVSFFDYDFVEYMFPGTPLSSGLNSHALPVFGRIEITVQAHHLYKYVYGVDISTDYIAITVCWRKKDYISIYSGEKGWKLQVRNRGGKSNRTTIHEGWIQFRDDLGLHLGDVVVLECARNSRHHFSLQVVRNHGALD